MFSDNKRERHGDDKNLAFIIYTLEMEVRAHALLHDKVESLKLLHYMIRRKVGDLTGTFVLVS